MYSKSQLAAKWCQYYVLASNSRGHGIHSPFIYQLIREVFNDTRSYYAYTLIETAKRELLGDDRLLRIEDLGAVPGNKKDREKKVSEIAGKALSEQKFGRLLFRLAHFYKANTIIELGTSLGISTAYLASANPAATVTTLEGSNTIASIATETFEKLKLKNIVQVVGSFEDKLPAVLLSTSPADLVFIDGNHRKQPVLNYFEQLIEKMSASSVIIIHDIHWSREMEEAWELIKKHPKVNMSVDIFSAGLVFFRNEFQVKQNFIIRF